MGRKIICDSCETVFKEEILGDAEVCPVCGKAWAGDEKGEDKDLDFDNPDLYFYSIDDEDEYDDNDLRDVYCNCISCREVNTIPYNDFDYFSKKYLKLKKDLKLKCAECGKEFSNIVVPKRPDGWRRLNTWEKENTPRCPICSSIQIKKISMTNKAMSAVTFGILAAGHVSKTYKCQNCGAKF